MPKPACQQPIFPKNKTSIKRGIMKNNKQLLAYYGLKWNPFLPDIPVDALWSPQDLDIFNFRLENLVMDGKRLGEGVEHILF